MLGDNSSAAKNRYSNTFRHDPILHCRSGLLARPGVPPQPTNLHASPGSSPQPKTVTQSGVEHVQMLSGSYLVVWSPAGLQGEAESPETWDRHDSVPSEHTSWWEFCVDRFQTSCNLFGFCCSFHEETWRISRCVAAMRRSEGGRPSCHLLLREARSPCSLHHIIHRRSTSRWPQQMTPSENFHY